MYDNLSAQTIRAAVPKLFAGILDTTEHRGGTHQRHIYGKPRQGNGGAYFVTSEALHGGRIYVVRRLELGETDKAPEVHRTTIGAMALRTATQLAKG